VAVPTFHIASILYICSFFVPQKVRFIATALLKQVWRCSFGLTKRSQRYVNSYINQNKMGVFKD